MEIMHRFFFLFLQVIYRPVDTFVPSDALELLSHLDVQSVFPQSACSDITQRWKSQLARSELYGGWVRYPQWCVGKQLLEIWSIWDIFLQLTARQQ